MSSKFYAESAYLSQLAFSGKAVPNDYNPLVQKERTNRMHLGVVVRQYSKLMENKVDPRLVIKVIIIARDRMKNYVDNGGSMTKTVDVVTDPKGDKTSITVNALQKRVNKLVSNHAEEVAAFDEAEKIRIAKVYEASKQHKGY